MVHRGSFDAASHRPYRWHTYPKGVGMTRLDATDVAWWSDAGALSGIELPNLAGASTAHQGVTLGTPGFFNADSAGERCAIQLDGTNDSISIGAAPYSEGYFDFRQTEIELVTIPYHASFNVANDITILVKLAAGDWTPGGIQTLAARWLPGTNHCWLLRLNGAGHLMYNWSLNGTTTFQVQSSASVTPAADGNLWVAVAHDVNTGTGNAVRFLTSTSFSEPSTMTVLSTHTDPSTVTGIYASTSAPIRLGSRDSNQERLYGRVKTLIVRGSINGTNIGLTNEVLRIDADVISNEADTSLPMPIPSGHTATLSGDILRRPVGGSACFGPGESGTIILCGQVEATQPSGARLYDSQPASLMGGQAIHATATSGTAITARTARAGLGTEVTVAETASTAVPDVICLRIDRAASLLKLWTNSGGETTTALSPTEGSSQRFTDIRIGSSNENSQYANFDFYSGAILRGAISDADRTLIKQMFLDASDTYNDGDTWTVTTPGIFDATFYNAGDQVLATGAPTGMDFTEVDWARIPMETLPGPPDTPVPRTSFGLVEMNGPPSPLEASFFEDPVIYPYRRLDIHNPDGSLWIENAPLIGGSVNIDYSRDERRSGDCEVWLPEASIGPGGLWYDKTFKFYRGLTLGPYHRDLNYRGATLVWQIGSFVADRISEGSESANFKITFRDQSKRMMLSKTTEAITFPEGTEIATVIRALAANSGIFDMLVPATGKYIGKDFTFETGTSRWEIAKKISSDFGYELFFDHRGWLVMRPFIDPLTSPIYLSLVARRAGLGADGQHSNVGSYDRSASDERIYNHIVVIAEGTDRTTVYRAEAENTIPNSPTAISRIGRRTMTYNSSFITSQEQAQSTANSLLGINALEQFTISVGTIVYPWIEVGTTINFEEDKTEDNFPSRYLLLSAGIPLGLDAMSLSGSRVTIVGSAT